MKIYLLLRSVGEENVHHVQADGDLNKSRIYDLSELFCAPQVWYSTTLLYPAYKDNNQMWHGLGRVCATQLCCSVMHMEFLKFQTGFFVE